MNFKELMDKYRNGIASEEEKLLIKQEIEKYEAIEEYLSENIDIDFIEVENYDDQRDETIKLKKSVNSRLRRVVITSVSVVMLIILGIFFVLSPIIDSFYYNPTKVSVGQYNQDIYFDLTAFTELNLPGYSLGLVTAERLGFGNYNIYYSRHNLFTKESKNISSKIKRDTHLKNFENIFEEEYISLGFQIITNPEVSDYEYFKENKNRVMSHIKKLNPVSYVSAYLTFEEDLTMEEIYNMLMEYDNIEFAWIGIRTAPKDEAIQYLTGFKPPSNAVSAADDRPDKNKYPAFQLLDWLRDHTRSRNQSIWPEGYELHYKSLLRYMIDRKDEVNVLDHNHLKTQHYQSALDYVEEHGVKSCGVLIYANAENLLTFIGKESIFTIELDQVMASKRYIR